MRENDHGWCTVPFWGNPPGPQYAIGDVVVSGPYPERGIVAAVHDGAGTFEIVWSDGGGGAITYPMDATYIRKVFPWE